MPISELLKQRPIGGVAALLCTLFLLAFFVGPFQQLALFSMMPGEIGDAVLNNYFLENIYLYISGKSKSLVDLSFFYPFPSVLGFSDNLFGASPLYLIPRFVTGEPDTAFQVWFLLGYVFNYLSAYFALRQLRIGVGGAAIGGLIFAFGLPVAGHSGHAQLHYRFGVPLSISAYVLFLESKNWRYFIATIAWLVWQLYCTIYIGFFLLFALSLISCVFVLRTLWVKDSIGKVALEFVVHWMTMGRREHLKSVFWLACLSSLLVVLFYPYVEVSLMYGAKRSFAEVAPMLPRPESYLIADRSWLWAPLGASLQNVPMRHEHQMFFGAVPLVLLLVGVWGGIRTQRTFASVLIGGSMGLMFVLTLYVFGISVWYVLGGLPFASAIRAMTRIDLVMLFFVSYFSAVAVDAGMARLRTYKKVLFAVIVALLLFEVSTALLRTSSKAEWRDRISVKERMVAETLVGNSVLFFAQSSGLFYADELDAMWVALKRGVPTLNGYSGLFPPGYMIEYGDDCSELPRRIIAYLKFIGEEDNASAYRNLASRVVPVGFLNCEFGSLGDRLPITYAKREYTADEVRKLSLHYVARTSRLGREFIQVSVSNGGDAVISALSAVEKPIRVAWRYMDSGGVPRSGWDQRKGLPLDIPANGNVKVEIPIDTKFAEYGDVIVVSLVQEGAFWAHDIGVSTLILDLKSR